MIRPARADEGAVISKALNTPMAVDGSSLPPLPVDEARQTVSDVIAQMVETSEVDDYFIGQVSPDVEGGYYTTLLGAINSALAFLLPGVMLRPDGQVLTYFVDEDRFISTLQRMQRDVGLVVNIKN